MDICCGRQILDMIFLAKEMIREKVRLEGIAIMIDLVRAYDYFDWHFVEYNIGTKWSWILECISKRSFPC